MRQISRLVSLTSMAILFVQAPGSAQSSDHRFELGLRGALGDYWTVCRNTLSPVVGLEASWRFGWTATATAEFSFMPGRDPCGLVIVSTLDTGELLLDDFITPRFARGPRLGLGVGPELQLRAGELSPGVRMGVTWVGYGLEDEDMETDVVPWASGVLGFQGAEWGVGLEVEAGVHQLRSRRRRRYFNATYQPIGEETRYYDTRLDPFVRFAVRWRWRQWM